MHREGYIFAMILAAGIGTILTRALPFALFPAHKKTPEIVLYLGKVLPFASIAMLVVYSLKDSTVGGMQTALPAFLSIALTVALHLWKSSTLVSIASGTIFYMLLVQFVFV